MLRIAYAVALEGSASAMACVTIHLHNDPPGPPDEVGLVGLHMEVDFGPGKAMVAVKREEHLLQIRAGQCAAGAVLRQDGTEPTCADPTRKRPQSSAVEAPVLRLIDRALEPPPGEHVGQIDERASRRGHRYSMPLGDLCGCQGRSVDENAVPLAPARARNPDLDPSRAVRPDAPQGRGTAMAQHGPFPAGKYSGYEPSVAFKERVADRVHAPVDRVQPSSPQALRDRAATQSDVLELPACDHTMLALSELGDPAIRRGFGSFGTHMVLKAPSPHGSPPVPFHRIAARCPTTTSSS